MLIETKTVEVNDKTLTIEIYQDELAESPREWDNLSTFAFFHRRYENESDIRISDFGSLDEIQKHIEKRLDAICIPVYMYSHGGDTISTTPFSCPWDSGQLGFAYITKEKARKELGWKLITQKRKEELIEYINGEIKTFDQYIRGEIYGYVIKDGKTELNSCWGYYGKEYCLDEAESLLPHIA